MGHTTKRDCPGSLVGGQLLLNCCLADLWDSEVSPSTIGKGLYQVRITVTSGDVDNPDKTDVVIDGLTADKLGQLETQCQMVREDRQRALKGRIKHP